MEQVDKAAQRVRAAFDNAGKWSLADRLEWLRRLDSFIALEKETILKQVAHEKSVSEHQVLLNEYIPVRLLCKYYLRTAAKVLGDEDRSKPFSLIFGNKRVVVKKEPFGVAAIITPANYPFSIPMGAVISALLAGNAVLLKTASEMPASRTLINGLIKASLEHFGVADLFETVAGEGASVGEALVRCSLVDKVHFTGSTQVGRRIAQVNAEVRFTPPTLELGGSNAAIVLEDVNLKQAAQVVVWGRFCGMSCNNIKRVFVVEQVYEDFYKEVERQVLQLTSEEVPDVLQKEKDNYERFVADYTLRTNELVTSPRTAQILRVIEPNNDLLVLREETFVPLLPIVRVKDEAEAVRWANQSSFGLGASVFTRNKKRFVRVADQLECGGVFYNDAMAEYAQSQVPFGGWKQSGCGYSHGPEGLLEFVRFKTYITERWPAPKLQLYPWTKAKMRWLRKLADVVVRLS